MFADLHLHTNFSDGTYTPEELAEHAARYRFKAVALTDHDTVEGCARMAAACKARGIEFVPGSELTVEHEGHELHVLAYFIDAEHPRLLSEMAHFQKVRQERIVEIVARLNEIGIPLKSESVFAIAKCNSPGRPHVGRALVQAKICSSVDEAFERFLKRNRPGWVPKFRMSAEHAIELIHEAGGLAVLAHPALNRADDLIEPLAELGLDGIECYHTKHGTGHIETYSLLAERLKLLVTGGSDCHGMNKGRPLIGSIKVPYQHVERLRTAAETLRGRLSTSRAPQ
ncbi:MAG TPA: PHP domain-containing protein [Methylomirabilota bacterium]|nr:PHP domain-containing protein [Methylomirabilota bacterium]